LKTGDPRLVDSHMHLDKTLYGGSPMPPPAAAAVPVVVRSGRVIARKGALL